MMNEPVFISLVGMNPETDLIYKKTESLARQEYSAQTYEFLGDPFKDYNAMRIEGRSKADYEAVARVYFRKGFFYQFNYEIVRPAFERGVQFAVVRKYGYDLCLGAVAYKDCDLSFEIHKENLPYSVSMFGINPPIYIFTDEVDDRTRENVVKYFGVDIISDRLSIGSKTSTGQWMPRRLSAGRSIDEKARAVMSMINNELIARKEKVAV